MTLQHDIHWKRGLLAELIDRDAALKEKLYTVLEAYGADSRSPEIHLRLMLFCRSLGLRSLAGSLHL